MIDTASATPHLAEPSPSTAPGQSRRLSSSPLQLRPPSNAGILLSSREVVSSCSNTATFTSSAVPEGLEYIRSVRQALNFLSLNGCVSRSSHRKLCLHPIQESKLSTCNADGRVIDFLIHCIDNWRRIGVAYSPPATSSKYLKSTILAVAVSRRRALDKSQVPWLYTSTLM